MWTNGSVEVQVETTAVRCGAGRSEVGAAGGTHKKATGSIAVGVARSSKKVSRSGLPSATFEKRAAHSHSTGKVHNSRSWSEEAGNPKVIHHNERKPRFLEKASRTF